MASNAGKGLFEFLQSLLGGGSVLEVGNEPPSDVVDPEMEAVRRAYLDVPVDDPEREAKLRAILEKIQAIRASRG
jgi:hypothetical protein